MLVRGLSRNSEIVIDTGLRIKWWEKCTASFVASSLTYSSGVRRTQNTSVAHVAWINDNVENRNRRKWKGRQDRYKLRPVAAMWLFERASLLTYERGRGDGVCRSQPVTSRRRWRAAWESSRTSPRVNYDSDADIWPLAGKRKRREFLRVLERPRVFAVIDG